MILRCKFCGGTNGQHYLNCRPRVSVIWPDDLNDVFPEDD